MTQKSAQESQSDSLPNARVTSSRRPHGAQGNRRVRLFGVFGEILITLGVVLGLFIVWQNWWTDVANDQVVKQERSAVVNDWGATIGPDGIIGPPAAPSEPTPTMSAGAHSKPRAGHRGAAAPFGWFAFPDAANGTALQPQGRIPVPAPTLRGGGKASQNSKNKRTVKAAKVQTVGFMYAPALRKQRLWATPIVQGTSDRSLARGVGHYAGSAPFGGIGNAAVAGHRTTHGAPFRHIDSLKRGDHIVIRVRDRWFVYVLDRHKIVRPKDHWVLRARPFVSNSGRLLTLTSCHPLHSAARRFVWWGHLVRSVSAFGPPPVELKMKR